MQSISMLSFVCYHLIIPAFPPVSRIIHHPLAPYPFCLFTFAFSSTIVPQPPPAVNFSIAGVSPASEQIGRPLPRRFYSFTHPPTHSTAAIPPSIVSWFTARWPIETTFQEVREHLGFETPRQHVARSVLRTGPKTQQVL